MGSGKIGVNTGTIIDFRARRKKLRPCDCKRCKHGRKIDGMIYCPITGDIDSRQKYCKDYIGSYIKDPTWNKRKQNNKKRKVKRRPRK